MTKREKDIFMKMVNLMYALKRMGDHKAEIEFEGIIIKFEYNDNFYRKETGDDKQREI